MPLNDQLSAIAHRLEDGILAAYIDDVKTQASAMRRLSRRLSTRRSGTAQPMGHFFEDGKASDPSGNSCYPRNRTPFPHKVRHPPQPYPHSSRPMLITVSPTKQYLGLQKEDYAVALIKTFVLYLLFRQNLDL